MWFVIFGLILVFAVVLILRRLKFKTVIKIFKDKSVIVYGARGSGKDVLMSNVVAYRGEPYCSNMDYCEKVKNPPLRYPFEPVYIKLGGNKYSNFVANRLIPYSYPLPDGCDFYISDAGVYFPSHEDSKLDKDYPETPMFQALIRHLGDANFSCNIQALDRLWKKIREQAECYILCLSCKVSKRGKVKQKIRIYDRYQSALDKVEPMKVSMPLLGKSVKTDIRLERAKFRAKYGTITEYTLVYKNKGSYDSRRFKDMLERGSIGVVLKNEDIKKVG